MADAESLKEVVVNWYVKEWGGDDPDAMVAARKARGDNDCLPQDHELALMRAAYSLMSS